MTVAVLKELPEWQSKTHSLSLSRADKTGTSTMVSENTEEKVP